MQPIVRFIRIIVAFLAISAVGALGVAAQSGSTVSGTVVDESGGAIAGATIAVVDMAGASVRTTVTDAAGQFAITDLPAARYTIQIEQRHFEASRVEVDLTSRSPEPIYITLRVAGIRDTVTVASSLGYAALRGPVAATKNDVPLLSTPVSVQIVPRAVLDDQQTLTVQEAVKNVSGVQMPTTPYYDSFLIRGFDSGSTTFRDGLKLYGVIGGEDFAFIDHLEIAKGPNGMLYGRIQPGGLVAYVTKKPQTAPSYSVQQQVGSWGQARTSIDATGTVDTGKTLLYRAIGTFDRADSFVDYQQHHNWAATGALTWTPTRSFLATLQVEHYDQTNTNPGYATQQIPSIGNRPADVPRNWTQNDPTMWSSFPGYTKRTVESVDWSYQFTPAWTVTQRFFHNGTDELQSDLYYQAFNTTTAIMARRITYNPFDRTDYATNVDFTGKVVTGPVTHNLLFGVDWSYHHEDTYGYNESGSTLHRVPDLNVFAPVYETINVNQMWSYINAAASNVLYRQQFKDAGFYAVDQMGLGRRLVLLLGSRYDVANDASSQVYGSVSSSCYPTCDGHLVSTPTVKKASPNAGVLYKVTDDVSVYGSASQSFGTSTSSVSFSGDPFPPQTGLQHELGAKARSRDRVMTSLTVFDLYLRNRLTSDPDHPGFSLAVGETRSRGLEFDISGQATRQLSVIGSYTYDDVAITADSTPGAASMLGHRWAGVPLHSGSLWVKYDVTPGAASGWFFGAGVYADGLRQANTANTVQLPRYGRLDVMAAYRFRAANLGWTGQINVNNVLDATYFAASNGTYSSYGAPRAVMASIGAKS